jgi:hypothetical protein
MDVNRERRTISRPSAGTFTNEFVSYVHTYRFTGISQSAITYK